MESAKWYDNLDRDEIAEELLCAQPDADVQVEVACIERASNINHPCTRESETCELMQKSADSLAAYSMAVDALRTQLGRKNPPKEEQK